MARKSTKKKYSSSAHGKVRSAMRERKHGTLKSGRSGKPVKSRKIFELVSNGFPLSNSMPELRLETAFEKIAEKQVGQKPFPAMTDGSVRGSSLLLAAAMVLSAFGLALYGFETSRLVLGWMTSGIIVVVGCAYYSILHGL